MQELECQFGAALLDRSRRIETPTETSIVLHRYFQRLFAEERAAEQALAGLPSLEQGRLAIGASTIRTDERNEDGATSNPGFLP